MSPRGAGDMLGWRLSADGDRRWLGTSPCRCGRVRLERDGHEQAEEPQGAGRRGRRRHEDPLGGRRARRDGAGAKPLFDAARRVARGRGGGDCRVARRGVVQGLCRRGGLAGRGGGDPRRGRPRGGAGHPHPQHADRRVGSRPGAGREARRAGLGGQRRQLRDAGRAVARRGAGRPQRGGHLPGHGHRRGGRRRGLAPDRAQSAGRRGRAHDHADRRPALRLRGQGLLRGHRQPNRHRAGHPRRDRRRAGVDRQRPARRADRPHPQRYASRSAGRRRRRGHRGAHPRRPRDGPGVPVDPTLARPGGDRPGRRGDGGLRGTPPADRSRGVRRRPPGRRRGGDGPAALDAGRRRRRAGRGGLGAAVGGQVAPQRAHRPGRAHPRGEGRRRGGARRQEELRCRHVRPCRRQGQEVEERPPRRDGLDRPAQEGLQGRPCRAVDRHGRRDALDGQRGRRLSARPGDRLASRLARRGRPRLQRLAPAQGPAAADRRRRPPRATASGRGHQAGLG